MQTGIEIRRLCKSFGNVRVLQDVSLSIGPQEFIALLGPSGCGKTTLLRCLAGFERPDSGEIVIGGKTVFSSDQGIFVPPGQRQLGMVFQSYALWPHMRVRDNIGFGLELMGIPRAERAKRIETVLSDVGLDGTGERYPSELSGGQQQRVALARLLATRPPVFLMDEPLSNLDARLRMDMRAELKRLHRAADTATIYVTHDQSEAMTMADRVVVMESGRIQQAAPPEELYRHPENLFVAEFVGMPKMNFLPAKVRQGSMGCVLETDDFTLESAVSPEGGEAVIAARPEDIQILADSTERSVEFEVYAVLPAGAEVIVQLRRGQTLLYARSDYRNSLPASRKTVAVTLDEQAVNVFDKTTGRLIRPAEEALPDPHKGTPVPEYTSGA